MPKQYTITNMRTRKVVYSGNNAFKAVQRSFDIDQVKVKFSGVITQAVFNHIIALQERLN